MNKLLIADDEQIEREGLQMILQKSFPELTIKQARNGRIAVRMAEEFKPELVLMDIKMPGLNGLEAVERIMDVCPDCKFIMVTAYDTFEYARQAIKLGVKDYLIKPSKASEIIETVGKVLLEIEEERSEAKERLRQQARLSKALSVVEADIVTQLLFDRVHEVHIDELVGLLNIRSTTEKFAMLVMMPQGQGGQSLYARLKEIVGRTGTAWVGALYGRQIPMIVFRDPDKTYRAQAVSIAQAVLTMADDGKKDGWFVGIGNPYASLDHIRWSYQESLIASTDQTSPVKYRFFADMPLLQDGSRTRCLIRQEKQWLDPIRRGEWPLLSSEVTSFIQTCEHEAVHLLQAQQRVLEFLWMVSRVLGEIGVEAGTPYFTVQAQDYRQLQAETDLLLERIQHAYEAYHRRMEPDVIQRIKSYIEERSHEDISLAKVSDMVGLSPYYISKIFKDQLGMNYIDYLTERRIDNAKKLMLSDPQKSLKEIAYEVGYHDPNYFSKVFKKLCGESPTEFRKYPSVKEDTGMGGAGQ